MWSIVRKFKGCSNFYQMLSHVRPHDVRHLVLNKYGLTLNVNHRFYCSQSVTGPDIELIANGDEELEHKLKVLTLEVDVMRQEGRLVPDEYFLKDNHWQELLKLPTISARRRYLEYLFKISKKKENRLLKKEEKRIERDETKHLFEKKEDETYEDFAMNYNLQHNNLFLRVYDTTINQMYNNRLIQAMQFGQKLVVDCGYYDQMTLRENKNCAKQLMLLFAENRGHDDPYDLHFCNAIPDTSLMTCLHKHIATLYEPWFPLNLHETSYLDAFPKEQLVYLTPHCREELVEYDHNAVYIIGAIVDKVNTEPLSLAKAKKEGLRMAKLPLDRYLQWGSGSGKSLTLNQVAAILLDVKVTGDWKFALTHVPKRKVVDLEEQMSRPVKRQTWTPTNKVNFDNLSFNSRGTEKKQKPGSDRLVKIRSILYE